MLSCGKDVRVGYEYEIFGDVELVTRHGISVVFLNAPSFLNFLSSSVHNLGQKLGNSFGILE